MHILPQRCLLDLHSHLQQRKVNCPYFHVLRSRNFTVPAGKRNNNCKDQWIRIFSRSFGGRPVTVPEWRSTPSKESTTSDLRQLHSFFFVFEHKLILMLCHQKRDNRNSFPLKTLQQHLLCIPFIDKEVVPVE